MCEDPALCLLLLLGSFCLKEQQAFSKRRFGRLVNVLAVIVISWHDLDSDSLTDLERTNAVSSDSAELLMCLSVL